jgi:hypothetical protein
VLVVLVILLLSPSESAKRVEVRTAEPTFASLLSHFPFSHFTRTAAEELVEHTETTGNNCDTLWPLFTLSLCLPSPPLLLIKQQGSSFLYVL